MLPGRIGLRVRKEVVADRKFGEMGIRPWSDDEINQSIESGKLNPENADKDRGDCPVNVTFFCESGSGKSPKKRTFKLVS